MDQSPHQLEKARAKKALDGVTIMEGDAEVMILVRVCVCFLEFILVVVPVFLLKNKVRVLVLRCASVS